MRLPGTAAMTRVPRGAMQGQRARMAGMHLSRRTYNVTAQATSRLKPPGKLCGTTTPAMLVSLSRCRSSTPGLVGGGGLGASSAPANPTLPTDSSACRLPCTCTQVPGLACSPHAHCIPVVAGPVRHKMMIISTILKTTRTVPCPLHTHPAAVQTAPQSSSSRARRDTDGERDGRRPQPAQGRLGQAGNAGTLDARRRYPEEKHRATPHTGTQAVRR